MKDADCAVVGFEPDPADQNINSRIRMTSCSEMKCTRMHKAIYAQLDDCDLQFLPPGSCASHRMTGHDATCPKCLCVDLEDGRYVMVKRKQFPLMPLEAVNLYSMQGSTADPGLYAYWFFPNDAWKQCDG